MQAKIRSKSKIQQVRVSPRLVTTTENIIPTSNGNVYDFSNDVFWAFLSNLRSSSINSSDSEDLPMIPSVSLVL